MRALAFALLLAVTACPGGDVCMSTGTTTATSDFAIAGGPVTIPMTLAVSCGARVPSSVTVSVIGPDDENVPADGGSVATDDTGFTTAVTFTPTTPGGYHIAARFEPNLGLAQFDVLAAADRRNAPAAFTASQDLSSCNHLEVTSWGRLVCILSSGASVFAPGAQIPATFDGVTEYADDTLWVATSTTLSRLVDSDAGFVMRESGPLDFVPSVLLPTADNVVASDTLRAELLTPSDGGFAVQALAALTDSNLPSWRDGDVYGTLDGRSLCTQPLDGGMIGCNPLTAFTTSLLTFGVDTGGFWGTEMLSGSSTSFVYHIDPVASLSLKLPEDWAPVSALGQWEHAAVLHNGNTSMVLNPDIGLEVFTNDGETLGPVCTHYASVKGAGGIFRLIAR